MLLRLIARRSNARPAKPPESLDRFIADFAHEFKTPIAAIKGASELLEDGAMEDTSSRTRFLRIIRRETDRMTYMVNDLLEFSRLESVGLRLRLANCNLSEMLDTIAQKYLYPSRIEEIDFRHSFEGLEPVAIADPKRLEQILHNLLCNAFDFTPNGGRVSLLLHRSADILVLEVEDTGVGIPEKNIPRIFERFFTTERPGTTQKGTGLGLSIVMSIVHAHGGKLFVKSTSGKGSTFRVEIPQPPRLSSPEDA